jgi:hypothetical protein
MVSREQEEAEIVEIMEVFGITKTGALLLIDSHNKFIGALKGINQPKSAAMLCITTAATIASESGMTPYDFFVLVREVMEAVSEDAPSESVAEA